LNKWLRFDLWKVKARKLEIIESIDIY